MSVKPGVRFLQEFGGNGQVHFGGMRADVPHEGRQERQPALDIGAFVIPAQQAVDGEGVPLMPNSE
jgi:hypothetical protein